MSAGTLTLTNNSAAVPGSGTAFTTELAAGDFIVATVGGIPYTLAIKTVNSNTSLTLVSSYTGPTQAGAAWYAVPRVAMNLVTAALVAQSAEALRGLNYDKQNWQSIFSGTGNVTVTLPDGSNFTGPAWNSFTTALNGKADKVSGAVPVTQGGTGSTTAEGGRQNLGLGSSATKDIGTAAGNVMQVGAFNLGAIQADGPTLDNMDGFTPTGFTSHQNDGLTQLGLTSNTGLTSIILNRGNRPTRIHQAYSLRRTWFSYYSGSAWAYHEAYTTGNTTKSSDGTLKAASPVARVVKSREDCQREDIDSDGFSWCGGGTANEEAEGIKISRLDVGVYVLTGSAGLASEGWQLLPPMDPGGMGELGVVEAEQTESGGLTICLYKRKYILSDEGEIIKTKGELMDVPANSWIDVRLDMPESSAWNQRQKDAAEPAS
ncbi:phage tail fiber protein [Enterobacter cancerogenus]|uniref:phage tail fiber protein n=1 Tax=Enterobacter cancerogenus TaxID=69218 RepID=UPI001D0EC8BE|nr:phage tail protein [Enterobacter cancerogenus]